MEPELSTSIHRAYRKLGFGLVLMLAWIPLYLLNRPTEWVPGPGSTVPPAPVLWFQILSASISLALLIGGLAGFWVAAESVSTIVKSKKTMVKVSL
jgi:hypothetical protein